MSQNLSYSGGELRALLGDLLRTRHVSQPLVSCNANEECEIILERMRQQGFSVLGVEERGRIIGAVERQRLRSGSIGEQTEPIREVQVIDGDDPLLELLRRFVERRWLFVRHDGRIIGFVSRSDLQRAPVRMLIFGLISLFELWLLERVQRNYSESEITTTLNAQRLDRARNLHAERQKRGEELQLVDCLQIADKRDLLIATDGFSQRLGFESNKAASRFFGRVEELRDRLVHANDLIAGSSWEEVLTTILQLADFLSRSEQLKEASGNLDGNQRFNERMQ